MLFAKLISPVPCSRDQTADAPEAKANSKLVPCKGPALRVCARCMCIARFCGLADEARTTAGELGLVFDCEAARGFIPQPLAHRPWPISIPPIPRPSVVTLRSVGTVFVSSSSELGFDAHLAPGPAQKWIFSPCQICSLPSPSSQPVNVAFCFQGHKTFRHTKLTMIDETAGIIRTNVSI